MKRLFPALILLFATACGLAENERDDKNKREYITFSDPAFEKYCLREFDLDANGRISLYEAQRVLNMNCSGLGIRSLLDISYFSRLQHLACSDNDLTQLYLGKCVQLRTLVCSGNRIATLDVNGLRSLTDLDCARNRLARLDLQSNASLARLDCRENLLTTLDVSACSSTLQADTRDNPDLTLVYCRPAQGIDFNGPTRLVER